MDSIWFATHGLNHTIIISPARRVLLRQSPTTAHPPSLLTLLQFLHAIAQSSNTSLDILRCEGRQHLDPTSARKKPRQAQNGGGAGGGGGGGGGGGEKKRLSVLREEGCEVGGGIEEKYALDRELGRGEFRVTYLCMDRGTREVLACKSISKRKLQTPVDVEDLRREVAIMRHLPKSPSIVTLREACEDDGTTHLVMELCEGGELFDRIVARGHYMEHAVAMVTRTIVEVVQLCHRHGVIHGDLKPENFLFANKKEIRL